ncbi:sugar ABC transporter ATP-binding protein [Clostridium sp. HMP27]|uniref:sugar ABC transporter ATP-binding protein n=1 Tax=Clostridium sp. HMP27 TaxID=1487921 RepID=UPI00052C80CA|nr:sugar ABC transporter ATP-binding protein [Clostridium sp. HMP27]KGK86980.1 D-ribose transporter ATP-binding protein [Clostridium sp. HMP27]
MDSNVVLLMENIDKSFPGVKALKNASLELRKGEVHVLLGENGAGKSTLMKILGGVYTKDSGKIYLEGKETEISGVKDAKAKGISIIFQELNLIDHLTVAENIFIGNEYLQSKQLKVVDYKTMNKKTQEILKELDIDVKPNELVKNLSIGQKQMIEIAKSVSFDAKIIVMDEPTSSLTDKECEKLFQIVNKLKKQGVAIVYISHKLEEFKYIVDRITIMRDGEYVKTVDFKTTTEDELVKLMIGRDLGDRFSNEYVEKGEVAFKIENITSDKVRDVSFEVRAGEIVGLYGLMGSGRTETAMAVVGYDKIKSGKVYIENKEVKIKQPKDAVNAGIAYVSEDRRNLGVVVGFSVAQNINLSSMDKVSSSGIINENEEKEAANRFVKSLSIKTPNVFQKVKNLSGGNQQKVAIAKWLQRDSKVYIFDEPTRGIDIGSKAEIYKLIKDLAKNGHAIIVISSEMPEIIGLSDRVVVMNNGRVTGTVEKDVQDKKGVEEKIMKYAIAK